MNCNEYYWSLEVRDYGLGISDNAQKKLFKEFYRGDNKVNSRMVGSGIGLLLVKNYVLMHEGKVSLESKENEGSLFKINIPYKEVVEVAPAEHEEPGNITSADGPSDQPECKREDDKSEKKKSILIVDDNKDLRNFLKCSFENQYNILEAGNGNEAWELLQKESPELIISDVMMPDMDGFELCKLIKSTFETSHIPVILLTSLCDKSDQLEGLGLGAEDYITKPFSATYLKTRIASLLRQRKSLQEIYMAKLTEGKEIAVAEALTPSQPQITPYDEQFMQKVMEFIEEQMDNAELTIDEFAEHLMLSRTIFYRKLKSIIGLTPVDFIREVRIKRAAQLIDSGEYNFSHVAYMTGFNDPKYFSKCFKKVVGITPSEYKEKNK